MTAVLHLGDCLDVMKTLPDKSIDCFICDLPYGCLQHGGVGWDVKVDLPSLWTQIERLAKNDNVPILMFCTTRFGAELINSKPKWYRHDLVWDKMRGISFLRAKEAPLISHEMIYVFSKKKAFYRRIDLKTDKKGWEPKERDNFSIKVYGDKPAAANYKWKTNGNTGTRCVLSVLPMKKTGRSKGRHPTEKPIDLYKFLLERYCPEKGTVLDPTAGSFNSIRAARELGLNGIGIEKNKEYYDKAFKEFNSPDAPPPVNTVVYSPEEEEEEE